MKKLILTIVLVQLSLNLIYGCTFLFIGDSITDGNWGSPQGYPCSSDNRNHNDKNHILGHGYMEMIAGELMGEFPDRNYEFLNRGISGETLTMIAARWDKDVTLNQPDVISLFCGTNDVHYWLDTGPSSINEFDFKRFIDTLDSLVNYSHIKLPEAKIFICTPFVGKAGEIAERSDFELRKSVIDKLSILISDYISEKNDNSLILVDFNSLLKTLEKENVKPEYWVWDGIHPTTAMHHRMKENWIEQAKISEVVPAF